MVLRSKWDVLSKVCLADVVFVCDRKGGILAEGVA